MIDALFMLGEIRAILLYFLGREDGCIHGVIEFILKKR